MPKSERTSGSTAPTVAIAQIILQKSTECNKEGKGNKNKTKKKIPLKQFSISDSNTTLYWYLQCVFHRYAVGSQLLYHISEALKKITDWGCE